MYQIVKVPAKERQALFRNTATKTHLHEAVIEKDFWVCLILDYLFSKNTYHDAFAFKGGTSLSKSFGLIKRFSEDIDLILDWRILGYQADEPWLERSHTKQDAFNKEANQLAEDFLKNDFLPGLINDLSEILETQAELYIDDQDKQTIHFVYPHLFENQAILPTVRLEIGSLAAWTPAKQVEIKSYASEEYPKLFKNSNSKILTVLPERTFWEKATILHHEANRPEHLLIPKRYSRHYYDVYCMSMTSVKHDAFQNLKLLDKVIRFKMKFYPRGWANYQEAKPGTFQLMPPLHVLPLLENDYQIMKNMVYGQYPSFNKLMKAIQELEDEINTL